MMQDLVTEKWEDFLKRYYWNEIIELSNSYPEKRSLLVKFSEMDIYDPTIADMLLDDPEVTLDSATRALREMDIPTGVTLDDANLRIIKLPRKVKIRDIRSNDIGKLVSIEGLVTKATEVRPRIVEAAFECPFCHHIFSVLQSGRQFKEPYECPQEDGGCGRKVQRFTLLVDKSKFVNAQKIRLQESPEELRGGELPQTLDVNLEDDIAGEVAPGDRVIITGILRSYQRVTQFGKKLFFDIYLDSNSLELKEEEFEEIVITEEDEREIMELKAQPDVYEKLVRSIAPSIYSYDEIKEATILQLFSGVPKDLPDKTRVRGDIHVLLVGDPGVAKSQLLTYLVRLAPRGLYTGGKSSSAAGLTAAAVRDEFGEGRWTLEAGALVLADKGIAAVDEIDKMRKEDRDALHEAMEQQSYHPSTEIMFSDGRKVAIGEIVDALIENNRDKIEYGIDCEILPLDGIGDLNGVEMLTLNSDNNIYSTPINRVSRHKAPDHLLRVTYSNGRSIIVTPEHPVYVVQNGEIVTVRADAVEGGMFAPIPNKYPLISSEVPLQIPDSHKRTLNRRYKEISFPTHLGNDLGRLLGYIVSEGHVYYSVKNGEAEVMISNTDLDIINDVDDIIRRTFDTTTYIQHQSHSARKSATKDLYTVRCTSNLLYEYMNLNFKGMTVKSHEKRIPDQIFASNDDTRIEFLIGAFRGDGFYDSERFGYVTNSIGLANDYSDLLLSQGIYSYITKSNEYWSNKEGRTKIGYKVVVSGQSSQKRFYDIIGQYDKRHERIERFAVRSGNKLNDHDRVPVEIAIRVKKLLKDYRMDDGYFNKIIENNKGIHRKVALRYISKIESCLSDISSYNLNGDANPRAIRKKYRIPLTLIAEQMDLSTSMVSYIERKPSTKNAPRLLERIRHIAKAKIEASKKEIGSINRIIKSDIRFVVVESVSRVRNDGFDWVYDVTVEPDHTFISNGLVLHNTVSIAKAGMMARLNSRCALLAAANPIGGRFNKYDPISKQINMPPTLLSRFDLIYTMIDIPSEEMDTKTAEHIIETHHAGELLARFEHGGKTDDEGKERFQAQVEAMKPAIPEDLLRKYVAWSKRNVFPVMSEEAKKKFSEFYIGIRRQGYEDEEAPVPITARQLEALIRLGEARARARLSDTITAEDAEQVIKVVNFCLNQVFVDPETGKLDVDWVAAGTTKARRDRARSVREIIKELEEDYGEEIPIEEVLDRAEEEGMERDKAEEIIDVMKRDGLLFSPGSGVIKFVR